MPEPSTFPKRQPRPVKRIKRPRGLPAYAELHCRTNYSFLEGASHADELVVRAAELGYMGLAITDRNSLAGVVRAHAAAKDSGLKLMIGAEITPIDAPNVVLLATDRAAYGRLSRLITQGRCQAAKGECRLTIDDVAQYSDGLLAGVVPDRLTASPTACAGGADGSSTHTSTRGALGTRLNGLHDYHDIFGDRCYLLAELHYGTDDQRRLDQLIELSKNTRIPLVAASDVHYHVPQRMLLQHVLTAIRHGTTVAELGDRLLPNAERHLRPLEEIQTIFSQVPEAVRRTMEIADCCTFSLDDLRYEYPIELAPEGETPMAYLRRLAWEGAKDRYGGEVPDQIRRQLKHELEIIEDLRYEAFFLTVYDLVKFARSQNILCQGRGSAANSTVCFCLGVTEVDPLETDLLFERFVSRERNEAPDIDVDFEHERREEVLQYIYQKYGRQRAGIAAEVITYRPRSAVRDVGKALGLSLDRVDALAKNIDFREWGGEKGEGEKGDRSNLPERPFGCCAQIGPVPFFAERCRQSGIDPDSRAGRQLMGLVNQVLGFPRHLGQHVGGMIITQGPLCELVPIENAAMPDRTVIQWDKDDLDELGILKVDCLALGMLTAIHKCFDMIEKHTGRQLTIANTPQAVKKDPREKGDRNLLPERPEGCFAQKVPVPFFTEGASHKRFLSPFSRPDPEVYDMISRADTIGVFQIESRAQMSMLPRLRPKEFYDLVIEVAIVRPGPIQGNMVHPYLRRRNNEEPVTYPNEASKKVLERTLGVPLFQEQAMQLAVVAAGFTPGEADQLRRAMGGWRRPGLIDGFRKKLIAGMRQRGLSPELAESVFNQIRGFGEYGFPESHAASFAKLAYVSAWLKYHYPAAFTASLINSQPMGFYAPAQLIRDVRNHGIEVRPIDVNHSDWDCTLEERVESRGSRVESNLSPQPATRPSLFALRLGMRLVRGLSQSAAEAIVRARRSGPFQSMADLVARTGLGRTAMRQLADADAFRSLALNRRTALWQALDQSAKPEEMPLFRCLQPADSPEPALPKLAEQEEVFADYHAAGLTLREHPMSFYREQLRKIGVLSAKQLADHPKDRFVKVAGLVLMRQRPSTAKGITFVTLEDETGTANLVIHHQTWKRYDQVSRKAKAMIAHGRLQREHEVIHVVVQRLEDLAARLHSLSHKSRDFR